MAINMSIEVTSGVAATDYTEYADDFQEAYDALKNLPVNRAAVADFESVAKAKAFVRQGHAWAAAQDPALKFERKGDPKSLPMRVSFRIYVPSVRGPLTDEQKAQRAATREANKAARS